MANYQAARDKLTNTQLNKLKSAAKNKTGIILRENWRWRWRITLKMKKCNMNYF